MIVVKGFIFYNRLAFSNLLIGTGGKKALKIRNMIKDTVIPSCSLQKTKPFAFLFSVLKIRTLSNKINKRFQDAVHESLLQDLI